MPAGRPPLYTSAEELQIIVDEYFEWCDNRAIKVVNKDGKEYMISRPAPYTMSGLARRLGMSRETLVQYAKKDQFSDAIYEARDRVQEDVETRMMETRNERGAQFSLANNFGWKNKQENEVTGKDGTPLFMPSEILGKNDLSSDSKSGS